MVQKCISNPNVEAMTEINHISHRRGLLAISPIVLFLVFYLVVSLLVGDFYKMPIAVAMLVAAVWAVAIYR